MKSMKKKFTADEYKVFVALVGDVAWFGFGPVPSIDQLILRDTFKRLAKTVYNDGKHEVKLKPFEVYALNRAFISYTPEDPYSDVLKDDIWMDTEHYLVNYNDPKPNQLLSELKPQ
jgi:hypothetical protein